MSMDIPIWSAAAPTLPRDLPLHNEWRQHVASYEFDGGAWIIELETTKTAPDVDVAASFPSAAWQTWVSLSPIGASQSGYDFLEQVVRTLCRASEGRWQHPADGLLYAHDEGPFE